MRKYLFFGLLFMSLQLTAQRMNKYDSTLKIGKAGYRITCINRKLDVNILSIKPIGFKAETREANLELKGRVINAEIDDLNNDGFPDILIYIVDKNEKVNVFSITSVNNERLDPIYFPDISNDMKLSQGYRGKDEFKLVEGVLFRKFPIYDSDTTIKTPTNKLRQIMYRVVPAENGYFKFKAFKNFDMDAQ